jgi:mycothiol maleylpyruvate isomerase-like protein
MTFPDTKDPLASFSGQQLAADLRELRPILMTFFAGIRPEDWGRYTEPNERGWTLRECLAHVTAIAESWQGAVRQTLAGGPVSYPGLTRRTDLPHFNQQAIAARQHTPPLTLLEQLLSLLEEIADQAAALSSDQLRLEVPCPAYNRPLTVAEMIGCQIAHVGIVHGAQLPNAVLAPPIWIRCSPELLSRLITYFFHQMSHSYWPERGGDLRANINFYVSGKGGGRWYLTLDPDGGTGGAGSLPRPALILWSSSPDTLCKLFTGQITPMRTVLTGQVLGLGNLRLGFRLPVLLTPT